MIHHFSLSASADDLLLSGILVEPDTVRSQGIVQFVHGMCDHKERYLPVMAFLAANGLVCVIHDHRGHGQSVKGDDDLGYMYLGGWRAMVEDVRVVNDWVRSRYPSLGVALFGHSMGSMVVRSFAKHYDERLSGLFVCGCPSYNPAARAGWLFAAMECALLGDHYRSRLLHALSFGTFNRPYRHEGFPQAWVCSDKDALRAYHADPLCMFNFTANGYKNLFGLMLDCYSPHGWRVSRPELPVCFLSGASDPCRVSDDTFLRAVELMRRVGYHNVDATLYPGMRHEILNETDKMRVWQDVLHALHKIF